MNSDEELIRILEQGFTGFRKRFDQIEERLTRLEKRGNTLLRETRVVEEPGLLGGRSIGSSPSGIERLVRMPVCDICGNGITLDDQGFVVCPKCRRKCCKDGGCLISYNGIRLCSICLKETSPLTKKEYKVLLATSQKVVEVKTIANLSSIEKGEVRSIINQLQSRSLINRYGITPFSVHKIAEEGLVLLTAYQPVYGGDDDVAAYKLELQHHSLDKQEVSTT